jgi:hypothetical protein
MEDEEGGGGEPEEKGWFLRIESPLILVALGSVLFVTLVLAIDMLPIGYFAWGAPFIAFGRTIDSQTDYVLLLVGFFLYRLLHEWARNVYEPFIDEIREHGHPLTRESGTAIFLVAVYDVARLIDLVVIIGLVLNQFSFFLAAGLAILVASVAVNYVHISYKRVPSRIARHTIFKIPLRRRPRPPIVSNTKY